MKVNGSLGTAGKWGKIWGYWAGEARPIPPFSFLALAISNEPSKYPGSKNDKVRIA
jgi:hypothetical protein